VAKRSASKKAKTKKAKGGGKKTAARRRPNSKPAEPKKPVHWDERVSAAYLRMLGATQKQAAESVGRSERTIFAWEHQASWASALAEARARWLKGCDAAAMRALLKGLQESEQATARWWADRRLPELKPPTVRAHLDVDANVSSKAEVHVHFPEHADGDG
jgi:hypothetical protein